MMRKLPPRVRQVHERTIQERIISALNRLPDIHVIRNNVGALRDRHDHLVTYGLGTGSPDLVGVLTATIGSRRVGLVFCLEVKRPGEGPSDEQLAWHAFARRRECFVATVTSVEEALAAVERARKGYLE